MDFLTVEVATLFGLVRSHVLFVIDIGSRAVEIAGIGREPDGRWMQQMARNLVDAEDGFLLGKRYVLVDRDPLYTKAFREILQGSGVKVVRLPAHSPNQCRRFCWRRSGHSSRTDGGTTELLPSGGGVSGAIRFWHYTGSFISI